MDIILGGETRRVTDRNKRRYIYLLCRMRVLGPSTSFLHYIREGLLKAIPHNILHVRIFAHKDALEITLQTDYQRNLGSTHFIPNTMIIQVLLPEHLSGKMRGDTSVDIEKLMGFVEYSGMRILIFLPYTNRSSIWLLLCTNLAVDVP